MYPADLAVMGPLSPSGAGFQPARSQDGCATREGQGEGAHCRSMTVTALTPTLSHIVGEGENALKEEEQ